MRRVATLTVAGVLAAISAWGLVSYRRFQEVAAPAWGTFPNGMAYVHVGTGPKTLLFLRGLTGVPFGRVFVLLSIFWMGPFLEDGYTIWVVARKRGLPKSHTVSDMADDTATLIDDEFDGNVDLVIGEEAIGGMTAFSLAARHRESFDHLAVMLAGYRLSDEGRAFERDFAKLLSEGRTSEAGSQVVRLIAPGLSRVPGVSRILGVPLIGTMVGENHPLFSRDVLVEAEAISAFDGRAILLIGCDRDFEFPKAVYEMTARLIPDCTLRIYEGKTGFQVASDKRLPQDVLGFVRAHGGEDAEPLAEPTAHVKGVGDAAPAS